MAIQSFMIKDGVISFNTGSHGAVKLIGGLIPEEGTVEVCMNGVRSSVCDNSWDYKDAFVVCRQLGYPATGEKWSSVL